MRSATHDHGSTAAASPAVVPETVRAAVAGPTSRSRAICGSTPCADHSCVKVATPAMKSAARSRLYSRLPRG